jgi:hypothetical protein
MAAAASSRRPADTNTVTSVAATPARVAISPARAFSNAVLMEESERIADVSLTVTLKRPVTEDREVDDVGVGVGVAEVGCWLEVGVADGVGVGVAEPPSDPARVPNETLGFGSPT